MLSTLTDNWDLLWHGFVKTLELTVTCGVFSLLLGLLLATFRLCPVTPLRVFGAVYVNILRNTPLTLLFWIIIFGLPAMNTHISSYWSAVLGLSMYTAAFICEAVRSGVNTVPLGQAEAARSLGLTFRQTLADVVLPQALRSVVQPVGSLLLAMVRNSAIAGAFNVTELFGSNAAMVEDGYYVVWVFLWIAVGYLIITLSMSAGLAALERRAGVLR